MTMERVVDAFCHIHPKKLLDAYIKDRVPQLQGFFKPEIALEGRHFMDEDYRIDYMDKYKIDREILSISQGRGLWGTVADERIGQLTSVANEGLYDICSKHEDKFTGTAILPRVYDGYEDEVKKTVEDYGFKGIMIYSNLKGMPLDSEQLFPLYKMMEKYDLPILIHPTNHDYYPWIKEYRMSMIFGWPFDTSLAMGRLVFSGILHKFPKLKFIVHHGGGMVPYFQNRISGFYEEATSNPENFKDSNYGQFNDIEPDQGSMIEHFRRFYADTVLNGAYESLKLCLKFYKPSHVVFATDFPYGPDKGEKYTRDTIESVSKLEEESGLDGEILYKNAESLFKI